MAIDVSIVLPTANRAKQLKNMLISLKKATEGISYELIIIVGGSSNNTLEVIDKFSPIKPQVYDETKHFGVGPYHSLSKLYNFGSSKSAGKWMMFASDDIVFSPGCISNAVLELNNQNDDVAGGIFFYKDTPVKKAILKDFHINYIYGQKLDLNFGLIRSSDYVEVGGHSEIFHCYYNDTDLALKLYKASKHLIPLPRCFVEHIWVKDAHRKYHNEVSQIDRKNFEDKWKDFINIDSFREKLFRPEDCCKDLPCLKILK